MHFQYKPVPRLLENALDLRAFEVSYDGGSERVVSTRSELNQLLSNFAKLSDIDIRTEAETALNIAVLTSSLCENWAEVAARVRDFIVDNNAVQPGYKFGNCSCCGTQEHGEIRAPFGPRSVNSFEGAFRAVSTACESGITIHTGVAILQQALNSPLPLEAPPEEFEDLAQTFASVLSSVTGGRVRMVRLTPPRRPRGSSSRPN